MVGIGEPESAAFIQRPSNDSTPSRLDGRFFFRLRLKNRENMSDSCGLTTGYGCCYERGVPPSSHMPKDSIEVYNLPIRSLFGFVHLSGKRRIFASRFANNQIDRYRLK
jgi:hypothetical protein